MWHPQGNFVLIRFVKSENKNIPVDIKRWYFGNWSEIEKEKLDAIFSKSEQIYIGNDPTYTEKIDYSSIYNNKTMVIDK